MSVVRQLSKKNNTGQTEVKEPRKRVAKELVVEIVLRAGRLEESGGLKGVGKTRKPAQAIRDSGRKEKRESQGKPGEQEEQKASASRSRSGAGGEKQGSQCKRQFCYFLGLTVGKFCFGYYLF